MSAMPRKLFSYTENTLHILVGIFLNMVHLDERVLCNMYYPAFIWLIIVAYNYFLLFFTLEYTLNILYALDTTT